MDRFTRNRLRDEEILRAREPPQANPHCFRIAVTRRVRELR